MKTPETLWRPGLIGGVPKYGGNRDQRDFPPGIPRRRCWL